MRGFLLFLLSDARAWWMGFRPVPEESRPLLVERGRAASTIRASVLACRLPPSRAHEKTKKIENVGVTGKKRHGDQRAIMNSTFHVSSTRKGVDAFCLPGCIFFMSEKQKSYTATLQDGYCSHFTKKPLPKSMFEAGRPDSRRMMVRFGARQELSAKTNTQAYRHTCASSTPNPTALTFLTAWLI